MGFFRKGGLVIVCILTFVTLLVSGILLTLTLSLKYENIQNELVPVVKEVAVENFNITDKLEKDFNSAMKIYCQSNSEFVFSEEGYTFVIPCSVVEQGSDAVIDYGVESFVKEIYYKEYDCDFWDCLKKSEQPLFLVSEKAQKYWMNKLYLALGILIVLLVLMYFLVEMKINLMIIVGSLLVVASLPFLALNNILTQFLDKTYMEFFSAFFSSAHLVFLISLIGGLVVLGLGIGLRIWSFGKEKVRKK